MSGEPAEQGEGIILNDSDVEGLRPLMGELEVYPVNLLAMENGCFAGASRKMGAGRAARPGMDGRAAADGWPSLRRYCGEALIIGRKAR